MVCYKDFLPFYCASTLTFFTPAIAVTLCVLCMPEAFCELETCAKMLSELCALCERKNSAASLIGLISYRGYLLFLTEKHRRTEHTKAHRDIKSTDFTEPYNHI